MEIVVSVFAVLVAASCLFVLVSRNYQDRRLKAKVEMVSANPIRITEDHEKG
jgi:hypothetical protein